VKQGLKTNFKEFLSCVGQSLVYGPFYIDKRPVGINKGKKMEDFSLEKKNMQISYAFQFFSFNHFA